MDSALLKSLLNQYAQTDNLVKGAEILNHIIALEKAIGNDGQVAYYNNRLGNHYQYYEQYNIALKYFFEAYKTYYQQKDVQGMAYSLSDIANIYYAEGFYDVARKEYFKQLKMFLSANDIHGTAVALNNIGLCYQATNDLDSALVYFNRGLETRRELNDPFLIAHSKIYIGRVYLSQGRLSKADSAFRESLYVLNNKKHRDVNDSALISAALKNLAYNAGKENDVQSAISAYEAALAIDSSLKRSYGLISGSISFAEYLYDIGKIKRADELMINAISLCKIAGLNEEYYRAVQLKCKVLAETGSSPDSLLKYLKELEIVTDTLLYSRRYNRTEEIQLAIDILQHDFESEKKLTAASNSRKILILILAAVFLALGIILYFFRRERKNERRFRQLANSTFEGVVIHHNNKIIRVNRAFMDMTGLTEKSLDNSLFANCFPTSEHARLNRLFNDVVHLELQTMIIGPDSATVPVEILNRPMLYKGKTINITAIRDITQLNRIMQENLLLRTAVEQNAGVVVMTDAKGVIKYVNRKFVEVTGYSETEAIGLTPSILKSGNQNSAFYANLWNTIKNGDPWKGEFQNRKKNGELYWENALITPVKNPDGVITHFIAIKEDITLKKQTEKELLRRKNMYRELVRQIPQTAVFLFDSNHRFLLADGPLLTDLGIQPQVFEGKEPGVMVKSEEVVARVHDMMTRSFKGLSTVEELQINGRTFSFHAIPVMDSAQEVGLGMVVLRDITEDREAQQKLIESESVLRELNSTKDKFFNILAHDLKNPFNIILGYADLLIAEFDILDDNTKRKYIGQIVEGAGSAFRLLNNLLEWARSQTGKIQFDPQPLKVSIPIQHSLQVVEPQAQVKGVRIQVDVNESFWVLADLNMVKTVFRNLLTNAIKFSYPGSLVKIYSELLPAGHPDAPEGGMTNYVKVTVEDQGIGIEAADLTRLFQTGEKVRREGTAHETGTGLGLLLCKEFVERNGGRIWVTSRPGAGSKFMVLLPEVVY